MRDVGCSAVGCDVLVLVLRVQLVTTCTMGRKYLYCNVSGARRPECAQPISLEGGAATIQERTKPAAAAPVNVVPNPLEDPAWMLRHDRPNDRPTERVATRGLQHGAAAESAASAVHK